MACWYKLRWVFLWMSVAFSCLLAFSAIYSPQMESRNKLLLTQKESNVQSPSKQLHEDDITKYREHSPYYIKMEVEALPHYRLPYDPDVHGWEFPFSDTQLHQFRLDTVWTLKQVPDDVRDRLILVTAASSDFYNGSMAVIARTQLYFPNHTLLVYDLENDGKLEEMVKMGTKGMPCQVQFRTFNFTKYPKHVTNLKTYAWKFLIVKEVLETHNALFWLDSSIYLKKTLPHALNLYNSSLKLMAYTGHSNYAVTHPGMYIYFPTNKEKQKKALQYEANSMLIVNTKGVFESVLKWVYLCSLHEECIAPIGSSSGCSFNGDSFDTHPASCHRFDQAAVNLLLANNMNFDYRSYVFNNGDYRIFQVKRGQSMSGTIKTCQ